MMISAIGSSSGAAAVSAIAVTTADASVLPAAPVNSAVAERAGQGDDASANANSAQGDEAPIVAAGAAAATSSSRVLAALTLLKFGG